MSKFFEHRDMSEINAYLCAEKKFYTYPEWYGSGLVQRQPCYDPTCALFLMTLCENVEDCRDSVFPLPSLFSRDDDTTLRFPGQQVPIYGYMFYSPHLETTFLVWSGTMTLRMWAQDAKTDPVTLPDYMIPSNTHDGTIRVHRGFLNIYEKTRDQILEAYEHKYKDKSRAFVVCGHSLGGAMTPLSVLDLVGNGHIALPTTVYTFAAPRVGNNGFAAAYDSIRHLRTTMRIFNTADVVPTLPPPSPIVHYVHVGESVPFTVNLGGVSLNHSEAYLRYMPETLTKVC